MRYRTWMLAVALGLIFTSAQAQETSQSAVGQAIEKQQQVQPIPIPLPVKIVEDDAAADARIRSADEAREREEARQRAIDDLIAQQGMNMATQAMNDATQRMAKDSKQMNIATWVGVVLLTVTLLFTYQANRAAVKAVEITRIVGQAQTAGYLDVEPSIPLFIQDHSQGGLAYIARIRNFGLSPIYITRIREGSGRTAEEADNSTSTTVYKRYPLAPNSQTVRIVKFLGCETTPHFYVQVEYLDIFDRKWMFTHSIWAHEMTLGGEKNLQPVPNVELCTLTCEIDETA